MMTMLICMEMNKISLAFVSLSQSSCRVASRPCPCHILVASFLHSCHVLVASSLANGSKSQQQELSQPPQFQFKPTNVFQSLKFSFVTWALALRFPAGLCS